MEIVMFDFLSIFLLTKRKINGRKFDYEDYLTELINSSSYFLGISNGEKFVKIDKQDNGEADVKTSHYELDFKLLVNEKYINNKLKAFPEVDFSTIQKGYISINDRPNRDNAITPSKANGEFPIFFNKLLNLTEAQIAQYESDPKSELGKTIKMFRKDKNLLFFLPNIIRCVNDNSIVTFATRLKSIFSLRDSIGKDTFLTVFRKHEKSVDDEFYILKYENAKFVIVDKICKMSVMSFVELEQLAKSLEKIIKN